MPYPRTHSRAQRRTWTFGFNAKAVYAALMKFGAPLEGLSPGDFAELGPFFHMGREPVAVDILSEIPGVDFDEAWERRVEDVIDVVTGLTATFIPGAPRISPTSKQSRRRKHPVIALEEWPNVKEPLEGTCECHRIGTM
jgi:hypothetical protein